MEIKRLFDILELYKTDYSELKEAISYKDNGAWVNFSASDYYKYSYLFACGLLNLGLEKGDKVVTMSQSLPHLNIVDMAISMAGLIHVPIYTTLGSEETEYILNHSDAKLVIVSNDKFYKKLQPIASTISSIKGVYSFIHIEGAPNWVDLMQSAKEKEDILMSQLNTIKSSITEDDLHTIVYTSGTTGNPKGVMLSHKNILTNVMSVRPIVPISYSQKVLSFLPFCHIYERMLLYVFQVKGCSIYYAEHLGTIVNDMQDIKPEYFNAVPRIIEKFYEKIISKGKDLKGIKKWIFFWAVNLGTKYNDRGRNNAWYNFRLSIADKLVFSKWRAVFGNEIVAIVSGGASLQSRLAKLFTAAGLRICEGYGLTETSPVIAVNWADWSKQKLGTVGPILDSVEVKLAEDGEIIVRGNSVMLGYYKDIENTKKVLDEDGWFHTGDIGEFLEGKFLKIKDRKKEIFKTSAGKYIAPQVIENKFKSSSLIEQLMIIGENEKFVSAIISPNFNYLHFYASKYKIHYRDNDELIHNNEIIKKIQKEIDIVNSSMGEHEKIKRFRLVSEEWSQITGELSPTLKLRRNIIYKKYKNIIDEIYGHNQDKNEKSLTNTLSDTFEKRIANGMKKLISIGNNKDHTKTYF